MTAPDVLFMAGGGFLASFLTTLAVLRHAAGARAASLRRQDEKARQAMHAGTTPRIGGLALFVAAMVFVAADFAPEDPLGRLIILSCVPVFLAGICEDLGLRVSPGRRLVAALLSGLLAAGLLRLWLPSLGLPGLDPVMAFWLTGALVTALLTAGVSNAFNLIDGLNGLAGFTSVFVAGALYLMAVSVGDTAIALAAILIAAAVLGFLVFNFPGGKIFLGDGGAYSIGHALSWLGVALCARHPEISPWSILLIFFWPVADTLLAIWRRRSGRLDAMQPDRMHFHHVVLRWLEISILGRNARSVSNPVTTILLLPAIAAPMVLGVLLPGNGALAALCVVLCAACFLWAYLTVTQAAAARAPLWGGLVRPLTQSLARSVAARQRTDP